MPLVNVVDIKKKDLSGQTVVPISTAMKMVELAVKEKDKELETANDLLEGMYKRYDEDVLDQKKKVRQLSELRGFLKRTGWIDENETKTPLEAVKEILEAKE